MAKEKKDPYAKKRLDLAKQIMSDPKKIFKTSGGNYWFSHVTEETSSIVPNKYVAYVCMNKQDDLIHGWGSTKIAAVNAALIHIESQGTTVLEYMNGWSWTMEQKQLQICKDRMTGAMESFLKFKKGDTAKKQKQKNLKFE